MSRSQNRIEVLYRVRSALVHYWGPSGLVYSVKNRVYLLPDPANFQPVLLGTIPWQAFQLICHIRLVDRALKGSILQVHDAGNQRLLVCTGYSWWSLTPGGDAEQLRSFSRTHPMNRGICTSSTGVTYIADYLANTKRKEPIRIYRSKDLRSFEIAWEFPPGDIRHIHALVSDPEDRRRIWVLTGDLNPECRILYTENDFGQISVFLMDGQRTRATDLIVRNGNLVWGMDSPVETSFLLSASKKNPDDIKILLELPGPMYYMTRNQAGAVYLGTSVEPGAGVKDKFGHIFGSRPDQGWNEILRRRNDLFPQHGVFYFPSGVLPDNYLIYSQRALHPQEGQMIVARDRAWAGNSQQA